jgi:hypothetical protein
MQFADEAAGSAALAALLAGKDGPRSAAGRDDMCTVVVSQVGLCCSHSRSADCAGVCSGQSQSSTVLCELSAVPLTAALMVQWIASTQSFARRHASNTSRRAINTASQVSPAVHERELLGAFARIAEPVRWHTSRGGATITFRTPTAAAGSAHLGVARHCLSASCWQSFPSLFSCQDSLPQQSVDGCLIWHCDLMQRRCKAWMGYHWGPAASA